MAINILPLIATCPFTLPMVPFEVYFKKYLKNRQYSHVVNNTVNIN